MTETHHNSNHVHFLDILLIALLCIAFFGYRLGSFVPLSDHEGYVAVTAQETAAGNWVVPHFDGQIRLQKTPLMYWMVALTGKILGQMNEMVIRLPSALSASGIAILLTIMGTIMFSRVTGLIMGLAAVSSIGMLWLSHVGIADMLMAFFCVLSMLMVYLSLMRLETGRSAWSTMIAAYIAFGLAMLAKGPVPIIAVLIPVIVHLYWLSSLPKWNFKNSFLGLWKTLNKLHIFFGLFIFIVIFGAWVVPVLVKVPDAIYRWQAEYVMRYFGDFGTERAWWYYFPQIYLLALPWSIFLPIGLMLPFIKSLKEKRPELMFVFLWLVVGFIFFSLSGGKRSHYILPIIPPAIMISALGLVYAVDVWHIRRWFTLVGFIVIIITGVGFLLGYNYVHLYFPQVIDIYRLLTGIVLFAEILALFTYLRVHILVPTTIIALTMGICFAVIWPLFPKVTDISHNPKLAADKITSAVGPDAEIYSIGKPNPPLIFYYGKNMPQMPEDQEILQIIKEAKGGKRDQTEFKLLEEVARRILEKINLPRKVFFIASDTRFEVIKAYCRREKISVYEVIRLPHFFSEDKSLVLFSNRPSPSTQTQ